MHKDQKDQKRGFNTVVPQGDYKGANLTFFNARVKQQLKEGDVIFFIGSIISYRVRDVKKEIRNSLDLIVYNSTILQRDRKYKEASIALYKRALITKTNKKKREVEKRKKKKVREIEKEEEEKEEEEEDSKEGERSDQELTKQI